MVLIQSQYTRGGCDRSRKLEAGRTQRHQLNRNFI